MECGKAGAFLLVGLLLASASWGQEEKPFEIHGWVAGRWASGEMGTSWLEGGWDRFDMPDGEVVGVGSLGIDLRVAPWLRLHVQGAGRTGQEYHAEAYGFTAGHLEVATTHAGPWQVRGRIGALYPGVTQEAVARLWASPYAPTFSAISSWIAEEVRPQGVELAVQHTTATGTEWELAVMGFQGCDTAGTLLAWRGWALGDRLSLFGEMLPLPPLPTIQYGGPFGGQSYDGTSPFEELDGREGWQARAGWRHPNGISVVASHLDNRGDRALYDDEYAWATAYDQAGTTIDLGRGYTLAAEWMSGSTGMGPTTGTRVDADFTATYVLLGWRGEAWRGSFRWDDFEVEDRDQTAENNDDQGSAWSVAVSRSLGQYAFLWIEYMEVDGDHAAAAMAGAPTSRQLDKLTVELRLVW
jgi:hypothetical protein